MQHFFRMMCVVGWLVCGADPVAAGDPPIFARKDCPTCGNVYFLSKVESLVVSKILINQGNCIPMMHDLSARPANDDGTKTYQPVAYPLTLPNAREARVVALERDTPFLIFRKPYAANLCADISKVSIETNLGTWNFTF